MKNSLTNLIQVECSLSLIVLITILATAKYTVAQDIASPTQELSLVQTWNISKDKIRFESLTLLLDNLRSEDVQLRNESFASLKSITGIDHLTVPGEMENAPERSVEEWSKYVEHIETAINQKIPLLLEEPTYQNRNSRPWAAMYLGLSAPHQAFLPLLKAILEDPQEDQSARYWALTTISQIPHEGLIEYLITQLSTDLRDRAKEQLEKLTKFHPIDEIKNKDYEYVQRRYREWWDQNKETFKYVRSHVLVEY